MLARGWAVLPREQHARTGASLLRVGASHPHLAAAGQRVVALTMQLPWLPLLPDSWEAQPGAVHPRKPGRPARSLLTLLGFSQVVPAAARRGNRPLNQLFVEEIYGPK